MGFVFLEQHINKPTN